MTAGTGRNQDAAILDENEPHSQSVAVTAEDRGRADVYRLLALLLEAPPSQDLLDRITSMPPDGSDLGEILALMGATAESIGRPEIEQEYTELFVGAPMPRFMPYASHYTDGHLFGRTLAELRMELGNLGVMRRDEATEPEDHVATLCEIMSGLLIGSFQGSPLPLEDQAKFFSKHIESWVPTFFRELEESERGRFYKVVARFGRTFIELETEAFRMV